MRIPMANRFLLGSEVEAEARACLKEVEVVRLYVD
jgi:hypothetical protein